MFNFIVELISQYSMRSKSAIFNCYSFEERKKKINATSFITVGDVFIKFKLNCKCFFCGQISHLNFIELTVNTMCSAFSFTINCF